MRFLSLFSGIEAASTAWYPLGWECVGVSEIEPFPCAVLAHHYPGVPNLGDITTMTEDQIAALGHIDLIVFGSPCQDLSVAGKRKGFVNADGDTTRSGLFFHALNVIYWARKHCGLRFALWENVPGAFSSNAGWDFAAVVGHLCGMDASVPPKGWGTEGAAVGTEGMVEWATLDAQWFGVAQRRRRVFALADFGNWSGRPPILLEPQSLRGDSPPRREAGQVAAGTLAARLEGGGSPGSDEACSGYVQPVGSREVAGALTTCYGKQPDSSDSALGPTLAIHGLQRSVLMPAGVQTHRYVRNAGGMGRQDAETETLIAMGVDFQNALLNQEVSGTLDAEGQKRGNRGHGVIAYRDAISSAPQAQAVAYAIQAGALRTNPNSGPDGSGVQETIAYTLEARAEVQAVAAGMAVRRLTPRECERLQGFPDDYTLIPVRGKSAADGPRYKALGNSMAVPVMRWIGQQIDFAMLFDVSVAEDVEDVDDLFA